MIKALLFDCWGTLFTNSQRPHPFAKSAETLGYQINDRSFLKKFEHHLMTNTHDVSSSVTDLMNELGVEPTVTLVDELVTILMSSTTTQVPFEETTRVLDELCRDYQLILISNTFKEGFSCLDATYNLSNWFSLRVLSYEEGVVKPDRRLYEKALQATELHADQVLMIGDNYDDDILAAKNVGIEGVLLDRKDRYPSVSGNKICDLNQLKTYL